MKRELTLKLFGPPKVVFQQKDIRFSFSKMEALFYYLAVSGEVNRDEIAGILWGTRKTKSLGKIYGILFTKLIKSLKEMSLFLQVGSSLALNSELNLSLDVQLLKGIR